MTSGPVVVQVLEGEDAVARNREVMGATDPAKAAPGTIRKSSPKASRPTASRLGQPRKRQNEIAYFFTPDEITG